MLGSPRWRKFIHRAAAIRRPPLSAVQPSRGEPRERRRHPSASEPQAKHYTPNTRSPAFAASFQQVILETNRTKTHPAIRLSSVHPPNGIGSFVLPSVRPSENLRPKNVRQIIIVEKRFLRRLNAGRLLYQIMHINRKVMRIYVYLVPFERRDA